MNALRMITIVAAALSMGLAFSHLMQLPPRMRFDGPTWLITQRVFPLYASAGGVLEVGAIILAGILAYMERSSSAFQWALVATVCLSLAFIVWIAFVAPANAQIARWDTGALPPDWMNWRNQWEYSHAGRFFFQLAGFCALLLSVFNRNGPG